MCTMVKRSLSAPKISGSNSIQYVLKLNNQTHYLDQNAEKDHFEVMGMISKL